MRVRDGLRWVLLGTFVGLGVALYVVAGNAEWTADRALVVAAAIALTNAATWFGVGVTWKVVEEKGWPSRSPVLLVSGLLLSTGLLFCFHRGTGPRWLADLTATQGSDGVLWQVQTTFLSVGFAGLAVAAQLFAEAPLAIGASRGRVLVQIRAGLFAAVGLFGNLAIAIETIWLPSPVGVLLVAVLWFVPTVVLLVLSTVRLMQLFGNPSRLDEVVRASLVEAFANRLIRASRASSGARQALEPLYASGHLTTEINSSQKPMRVPVSENGLVVRAVRPEAVRRAVAMLLPNITDGVTTDPNPGRGDTYTPPEVTLDVEPGDRTRLGDTAFRVSTSLELDEPRKQELIRRLQSAIEYEPPGSVTPDEETDREISNLKDTVSTSLRSGAFGTAERALELLGHVVRGVWTKHLEPLDSSRRSSFTRRDWLFWSVGEVEQDVTLSPRAAGIFISQAMTRALEAPRTGSADYVDECLRSFTRIWCELLAEPPSQYDMQALRIVTCVQNLAAYTYSAVDDSSDYHLRASWAMVDLVKLALDAKRVPLARSAARELKGLFQYSDRTGTGRAHVRAGQLVLSGWLLLLANENDDRYPDDPELRELLIPSGSWADILVARRRAERGEAPFSRWDWWEIGSSPSGEVKTLELSNFVDRAEITALANSHGNVPPAEDQATASEYDRFARLLTEGGPDLRPNEITLRSCLAEAVRIWKDKENARLATEPLSARRELQLRGAIRSALDPDSRLADAIPRVEDLPEENSPERPILGMNFRVPRHYLVDEVFNQTYADPEDLGRIIGRGFIDGEDRRIVEVLQSTRPMSEPTVEVLRRSIEELGEDVRHHVLVTPYGGLFDLDDWYSEGFRQVLSTISHYEVSVLEDEAILFDRRTLRSYRRPEDKDGLTQVEGTSLALGVFEDPPTEEAKEPQVRVETGEVFAVWQVADYGILRFASPQDDAEKGQPPGA